MADQLTEASPTTTSKTEQPPALRWEWRTFGRHFGGAEERIARLEASAPKESDEIYFLSERGDNVKVRDELMDIKVLREVNAEGLEQWAPIMKGRFPLSPTDAAKVIDALRIPHGSLRESYSLKALIEAFSHPQSHVRVVKVHKRRVRYTVEGCMAELSDITANGLPIRTIAVESENSAAIMRAIEALGLRGYANTNYLRALADLIDRASERYAIIDVGTNSVKFHLGARDADGSWSTIADRAELTRLGEGLADTRRIGDAALERTADAIAGMVAEAKRAGVRATAAVGTAGFRMASNAADIIAAIHQRTGVRIEIVSGDEEARLAYLATTAALGPTHGNVLVFDTGGGSSQFTFGHDGTVDDRFSVDVGAARYTERFGLDGAVSEDVVRETLAVISADLSRLDGRPPTDAVVGMGGATTNITAVALGLAEYDPERVQGATISREEIDRQIELYRTQEAESRRSIVGLQPKRAEVILAGACIVRAVLEKLGKSSLTVSDRGLRHGLLVERFGS